MIAENGNKVTVHYLGTFEDGTEFDSSYAREEPINFELGKGQMIAGFEKLIKTVFTIWMIGEGGKFETPTLHW